MSATINIENGKKNNGNYSNSNTGSTSNPQPTGNSTTNTIISNPVGIDETAEKISKQNNYTLDVFDDADVIETEKKEQDFWDGWDDLWKSTVYDKDAKHGKFTDTSFGSLLYKSTGIKGVVDSIKQFGRKDKNEPGDMPMYLLKPAAISSFSTIISNTVGKSRVGELIMDPNIGFYQNFTRTNAAAINSQLNGEHANAGLASLLDAMKGKPNDEFNQAKNQKDGALNPTNKGEKNAWHEPDWKGGNIDCMQEQEQKSTITVETNTRKPGDGPGGPQQSNGSASAAKPKYDSKTIYSAHINALQARVPTDDANELKFKFPDWGYQDFINERAIFQKSLYSGVGEKGWFYFKIFFNFDTQYGLLGGLLNNKYYTEATNSAAKFLYYSRQLYRNEKLEDRIVALHKFANILSYISSNAPWFFRSVKNLNQANVPKFNELSKDKTIEIEFNADAIDMRVTTLFDLYKFACFDEIGQKEIVPENLRKFDMTVVLFEAPLRYLHTGAYSRTFGKFSYKTLNPTKGYDKVMSFKMFNFMNCEFDIESLGNIIPADVNNEQPFEIGKGSIKIKYDRVYTHTMSEFIEIMFGSDGLYYNITPVDFLKDKGVKGETFNSQNARYNALQNALYSRKLNPSNPGQYKELMDACEAICNYNLIRLGGSSLGNLKGQGSETGLNYFDSQGKFTTTPTASKYWYYQFSKMAGKPIKGIAINDSGNDILFNQLVQYSNDVSQRLYGHGVWEINPSIANKSITPKYYKSPKQTYTPQPVTRIKPGKIEGI